MPLSFGWDGEALLATPTDSPTCRNLAATRTVRRIQAWREVNELGDRELTRDGWSV